MDAEELIGRARVVALPMHERFRGIEVREAVIVAGWAGWAEWSPFLDYGDVDAARWLASTIEEGYGHDAWDFEWWSHPGVRVNATVPAVDPEDVPGVLARFPGTRTAKVKVAEPGAPLSADVERVRAVRDVLGPEGRIRVDANAAWSLDEASTALEALGGLGLEYAEQPVAAVRDLAELRRRFAGQVRIAADESVRRAEDPIAVARAGAADVIVLKLQPLGGHANAMRIAERARAEADVDFVTSSALETSVGLAAAARFADAIDTAFGADLDHGLGTAALLAADVARAPLLPVDGRIPLGPAAADPDLLERWAAPPDRTAFWHARLRRAFPLRFQDPSDAEPL